MRKTTTIFASSVAALVSFACEQTITFENLDADITAVGPVTAAQADRIAIAYALRDAEGDDQDVVVEICEADEQACGPAFRGASGDPVVRVPTAPAGSDVRHSFVWNAACGRLVDGQRESTAVDTEYIARITLLEAESEPVTSAPFTLSELGIDAIGECD